MKYDKKLAAALAAGEAHEATDYEAAAAWLAGSGGLAGVDRRTALSAVQAAVLKRDIERLQALEAEGDKALRKAARAGLHKLRSAGVEVVERREATRFSLGTEEVAHWSTAWLSPPDPDGYSQVFLIWADADLVGFYLCIGGGAQGILEEETGLYPATRSLLRRLQKDLQAEPAMREIPFTTGLYLAQEAMTRYQELTGNHPMDWADFLANVPEGTRTAAQLLNPIAGFSAQVDVEGLQSWETLERLVGHDWLISVDQLGEVGLEVIAFLNSELEISDELRKERLAELEVKAGEAALTDEVRESIGRRLRHLAIYASAGGQADFASEAWNHYLAVTGGTPAAQLPYFCHVSMTWLVEVLPMMSRYGNFEHDHDHSHDHSHGHSHDH